MKREDFRKALEKAKEADPLDRAYYVMAPEIDEDAKIYIFPMLSDEREEVAQLTLDIGEWAIIIVCCKDEFGERLFEPCDVDFLDSLGFDFKERLFEPCFQLSGLGTDHSINK